MRLIDADALKARIKEYGKAIADERNIFNFLDDVIEIAKFVEQAPTVDAVPVVRCKDCTQHRNCTVEEDFEFCKIFDGYCRSGKKA